MRKALPIVLTVLAIATTALAADPAASAQGVVNINTASVQELQLLPRIGPALSQRIVDFREANGPFKSVDEMVAVKGIGERSLELLKPYVTVEGKTTLAAKVKSPRTQRTSASS